MLKKADKLARLYNTDFTLIIRKNEKYYIYKSTNHEFWLLTIVKIVYISLVTRGRINSCLKKGIFFVNQFYV